MIDQRVTEGVKPLFLVILQLNYIPKQIIKKYKCDVVPIYIERKIIIILI